MHVGAVLRAQRLRMQMSLSDLADALGIAYQQVQKYETGRNRVSASTLYRIAKTLRTPIADFFPGSGANEVTLTALDRWDLSAGEVFARLDDPGLRKALAGLIDALGRKSAVR
ncbi:helix-turn-helix transcriptional regulator [Aureimonas sp. AU4]|uniref:helix-turn-helix domain-containing protein n=1 Tax=Aureimonas sp. AU4 TaxID=1638163 RepID=UPI00244EFB0B|nr:helix-turn-helix transcriptional regulator [Aureimonas sp. AU4]